MKLPLLPLNAIVCPQGRIPLQIFELHYLDMIAESMKKGEGFVCVLMRSENASTEHVQAGQFYELGTLVKIVDFGKTPSTGVLNLTIEGVAQVKLTRLERHDDTVWYADAHISGDEEHIELPEEFDELRVVLQALVKHPYVRDLHMDIDFEDGRQVGWRLTELLPLGNKQKQHLYELNNPLDRLEEISRQISDLVT